MTRKNTASVAVVMLTLNQRETTIRALRSLMPQLGPGVWVLLWDNGSTDGTVEAVRTEMPEVTVHHHPTNLGVASGRNAGARLAGQLFDPEYLLFLDNDLVLCPGFVAAQLELLESDPGIGQTQAKLLYLDAPDRINDGGGCRISFWLGVTEPVGNGEMDRGQYEQVADCQACGGGAMMVRAGVFRRLGGFDSIFDPFGPEDLDFSLRLQQLGYRAVYTPRAVAYHAVSHTYEGGYTSVYARSKAKLWLRFLRRHGTAAQKIGFFMLGAPLVASRIIIRELWRGNPGAILASARGACEALRRPKQPRP